MTRIKHIESPATLQGLLNGRCLQGLAINWEQKYIRLKFPGLEVMVYPFNGRFWIDADNNPTSVNDHTEILVSLPLPCPNINPNGRYNEPEE